MHHHTVATKSLKQEKANSLNYPQELTFIFPYLIGTLTPQPSVYSRALRGKSPHKSEIHS